MVLSTDAAQLYPVLPTFLTAPYPLLYPLSRKPGAGVPLGTPTGVLQSLKGVGDGPNFLSGQAKKWRGLAKGVGIPLVAFFAYFLSHHRK